MGDIRFPKIALGAWAWGDDGTFGGGLDAAELRPVFDAAMDAGLNLWDTAYAYGMGASEKVLGGFLEGLPRGSFLVSDKLTPQCADASAADPVGAMHGMQLDLMGLDRFDLYAKLAEVHGVAAAQVPVAWAIAKGTLPIVGVTKERHVADAAAAADLSPAEVAELEDLADSLQINAVRMWEKVMD